MPRESVRRWTLTSAAENKALKRPEKMYLVSCQNRSNWPGNFVPFFFWQLKNYIDQQSSERIDTGVQAETTETRTPIRLRRIPQEAGESVEDAITPKRKWWIWYKCNKYYKNSSEKTCINYKHAEEDSSTSSRRENFCLRYILLSFSWTIRERGVNISLHEWCTLFSNKTWWKTVEILLIERAQSQHASIKTKVTTTYGILMTKILQVKRVVFEQIPDDSGESNDVDFQEKLFREKLFRRAEYVWGPKGLTWWKHPPIEGHYSTQPKGRQIEYFAIYDSSEVLKWFKIIDVDETEGHTFSKDISNGCFPSRLGIPRDSRKTISCTMKNSNSWVLSIH